MCYFVLFFWQLYCLSYDLRVLITPFGIFKLFCQEYGILPSKTWRMLYETNHIGLQVNECIPFGECHTPSNNSLQQHVVRCGCWCHVVRQVFPTLFTILSFSWGNQSIRPCRSVIPVSYVTYSCHQSVGRSSLCHMLPIVAINL